ncbi:MAG: AAA family ATPase [Spirochaetaceae bacterium]|nr:AAA family ATPase [Spirochaetaceae bacterium]
MSYPKPKIANSEIDLKLGIKSSLPNATQAIVLSYLIWKCGDKKSQISYSKQIGDGLSLKDELSAKISDLLQKNVEKFDKSVFDNHILNNPLLKAQIEALIVGFELVWKLARFQFVDGSSFSVERTGGKRFEKIISYTTNIDILDLLVQTNEKAFLQFFYEVLIQTPISNKVIFDSFRKLLTIFSETAIYKIEHGGNDLIFDNLGIYKSILEDNNVILSDDKENKGASRILKSSATEGLNYYLSGSSGAFGKNQNLTDNELKDYAKRVENFLALTNIKINETNNQIVKNETSVVSTPFSRNRIIFGAPGTGKSHKLKADSSIFGNNIERVTFHPNYSYAQFVGTYKPTTVQKTTVSSLSDENQQILAVLTSKNKTGQEKYDLLYEKFKGDNLTRLPLLLGIYTDDFFKTKKADGSPTADDNMPARNNGKAIRPFVNINGRNSSAEIAYEYIPGPFMRVYAAAKQNPAQNYLLLIEEINRANVAAVFGDVFQLLDRDENGNSEYSIVVSEDVKKYLAENGIHGDELSIPSNMYIWATMNSADQGVLPMDAAFKRRWDFEYIGIDDNENWDYMIPLPKGKSINWNVLRKAINAKLKTISGVNEDKLLGPYFLSKSVLEHINGNTNKEEIEKFINTFKSKVLMYLFEDVCKMRPTDLFKNISGLEQNQTRPHYSDICKNFDQKGIAIFDLEEADLEKYKEISNNNSEDSSAEQ